jgi:membrane protein
MEQPHDSGMADDPTGRFADNPWKIPAQGWKAVLRRSWSEASEDNIGIVAAGVSFYGFLALVPLLGAVVLTYGLVADPETVIRDVRAMTSVMPADAAKLIGEQLMHLVKSSDGKKGMGVLVALAIALFGARNGAGSVITALNIAYEEKDERGFLRVNLLALAITGCAVLVALVGTVAIAALGHLESLLPFSSELTVVGGKVLAYIALTLVAAAGAAALYRFGPARRKPRWIWLTPGSVLTAVLWLILTLGFGLYVARFGNYDASYGSLGAVVVMLTWLYLSSYVLLFGAELNSELEKQTVMDTTVGQDRPMGERGASAADHIVADASDPTVADRAGAPPSAVATLAAARGTAIGLRVLGARKVGLLSSALATGGLAALRRRGAAPKGIALLGAAAALSWLARTGDTAAGRRNGHRP